MLASTTPPCHHERRTQPVRRDSDRRAPLWATTATSSITATRPSQDSLDNEHGRPTTLIIPDGTPDDTLKAIETHRGRHCPRLVLDWRRAVAESLHRRPSKRPTLRPNRIPLTRAPHADRRRIVPATNLHSSIMFRRTMASGYRAPMITVEGMKSASGYERLASSLP